MKERNLEAIVVFGVVVVFGVSLLAKLLVSPAFAAGVLFVSSLLYVLTLVWAGGVRAGRDAIERWRERSLPAPVEPVEADDEAASAIEAKAQPSAGTGIGCFMGLALLFGLLAQAAVGILFLLIMYGVVVLIFRHAFGVELWNPFG